MNDNAHNNISDVNNEYYVGYEDCDKRCDYMNALFNTFVDKRERLSKADPTINVTPESLSLNWIKM